jgi:hypothetical protein
LENDNLKFKKDNTKEEWFSHNINVTCTKEGSVVMISGTSSHGKSINIKPSMGDYCVYSVEFTIHDEIIFHVRIPDYSLFVNESIKNKAIILKDLYKEYVMNNEMSPKDFNRKILENIEW